MVKVCPECHSENIDNALFCGNCGCNLGESSPGVNQANSGSTVTVEREDYEKVDNADSSKEYKDVEVVNSTNTSQNTSNTSTGEAIASCCGALIILFIIIWIISAG